MQKTFDINAFQKIQPAFQGKLHYHESLASTSDFAKQLAQQGAESGTLVIAENQDAGRGRGGNQWHCPAGDGLLFTLILEPDIAPQHWTRFSLVAGVAIAKAISHRATDQQSIQLKWPNDVYLNGKKCAGILTEIISDRLLIGIGLNVSSLDFPTSIEANATSLLKEGIATQREPLLADIISQILQLGSLAGDHFPHLISQYQAHCMLTGKAIHYLSADQPHQGTVLGINADGALRIRQPDGAEIAVTEAREIRVSS